MPIIPTGTAKVQLRFTLVTDPEDMLVTFGLRISDDVSPGMMAELSDAWLDALQDLTPETYTLKSVDAQDSEGGQAIAVVNAVGTSNGIALPQNCALLVRKNTGLVGRANRGRFFYPGVQREAVSETGTIDDESLSNYQDGFSSFLENVNAVDNVDGMVLLHSESSDPTDVNFLSVDHRIATQRRRLRP